MRKTITIDQILQSIPCEPLFLGSKNKISNIVSSGLMSDVLTTDDSHILLVSNLTSIQLLRTADMVQASGVLITNGKPIHPETIRLAQDLDISIIKTNLMMFEVCYQLGKIFFGDNE